MAAKTLKDLFVDLVQDAYSAETQLVEALPAMAGACTDATLRAVLEQHLRETKTHVLRLEKVAERLGIDPDENPCEAMEGLVEEGEEMIGLNAEPDAKDAGLIAAAQKAEHYEIATYGTLCAWAKQLGYDDALADLLPSLQEEKDADEKLTRLAERGINAQATRT